MHNIELTICIPTYNRFDSLRRQLFSLFSQSGIERVQIVLLDNHSNYNLRKCLVDNFNQECLSKVQIIENSFNIQANPNIAMSFLYCKTKWMWLLSDDDEAEPLAIQRILFDIAKHENLSMIKYSIVDFPPHDDKFIDNIDDFIKIYKDGRNTIGDLYFMSNCVYNISKLKEYLYTTQVYSYSSIPQMLPIIYGLANHNAILLTSSFPLVKYLLPIGNEGYLSNPNLYLRIMLGMSMSLEFIDLPLNKVQYTNLVNLLMSNVRYKVLIDILLQDENKKRRVAIFKRFCNSILCNQLKKKKYILFFYIRHFLGINFFFNSKK